MTKDEMEAYSTASADFLKALHKAGIRVRVGSQVSVKLDDGTEYVATAFNDRSKNLAKAAEVARLEKLADSVGERDIAEVYRQRARALRDG